MAVNPLVARLREKCRHTHARWALWVEKKASGWVILASYALNRPQKECIKTYLNQEKSNAWLDRVLQGTHSRPRVLDPDVGLACRSVHAFPAQTGQRVVLVGADKLSTAFRHLWQAEAVGDLPIREAQTDARLPDLRGGTPGNLSQILERLLHAILRIVSFQGGWLAVRSADAFEVKAHLNSPECLGGALVIEEQPLLRRMLQSRAAVWVSRNEAEWSIVPRMGLRRSTRAWAAVPLMIGQRVIGFLAVWRETLFEAEERQRLNMLANHLAPLVDESVEYASLVDHLRRLGLLSDFALTVSSALDLNQIVQRVFALFRRAFGTEMVNFFLLSPDGHILQHFQMKEGRLQSLPSTPADMPWLQPVLQGEIIRLEDVVEAGHSSVYPGARAILMVPVRYRKQIIGALGLESQQTAAFSVHDEHLIGVIAGHLAGLVENWRLRQEAELRVRNLELIHQVVQSVIGLTDAKEVAQIAADLCARYFAYDLAVVLLTEGEPRRLVMAGIGGAAAGIVQEALRKVEFSSQAGITSHVFNSGESLLVNDVNRDPLYQPLPGWDAGSEMCVALRDGDVILGIIDIESKNRNAFTRSDLLVVESLAGVLSGVILRAGQHQQLRATVQALQLTRQELQERIEAQRVAESRLIQAAKMAAVGEMAAGVAHELNNPLTTITGFTELVMDELPEGSQSRADLELVLREANRARNVVLRLLDFARQSESIRAPAGINEIVTDTISLVSHLLHTSGVQVRLDLAKPLPQVLVDRNQIKQVILNLISNALHAMPSGGFVTITTSASQAENREWVVIAVADTGIGIPQENMNRIFEPFFTTKAKEGGTGLGLSVSYGIIVDHDGFITVESQVEKGSCFKIWLPVEVE